MAIDKIGSKALVDCSVAAVDIAPGTVTAAKLASTLDVSSKTVTLPNTSVTNAQLAGSIANDKLANSTVTINGTAIALGASGSIPAVSWQSVITSDTTMVAGRGYFVNTSGGEVTMTLPSSASAGDTIAIKDYAANFGSNALTIARNGHNIQGNANNSRISTARASVVLVYIDSTKGWLFTNESNVADLKVGFIEATGGTVTTVGDFKVHAFTGDGCFQISTLGTPSAGPVRNTTQVLVVAGGGGGGGYGGGGGAGGFRIDPSFTVTATTYPVTVGGGGTGGKSPSSGTRGTNGSNSVFSTITSAGGGGGGTASPSPNGIGCGSNGGSGGGGAGHNVSPNAGGSGNTPPVSPSQGNNGGAGTPTGSTPYTAGGGGGAGAVGTAGVGSPNTAGPGGAGSPVTSTFGCAPQPFYAACGIYAGGGGGGRGGSGGVGGPGGGGTGVLSGNTLTPTTPGVANSGGGGGGVCNANPAAGAGGKGVVLIRYKFQ